MVYRNMIEFDAEEYNWENVAEVQKLCCCYILSALPPPV